MVYLIHLISKFNADVKNNDTNNEFMDIIFVILWESKLLTILHKYESNSALY